MELAKSFEPGDIETHWYARWESAGHFSPQAQDGAQPYCILLPPPNVTGTLHMGHAFQHTLMDTLIRYRRMRGDDTLWQMGTDHAGIATEMVVTRRLAAAGEDRMTLGREAFIEKVWEWKAESGATITRQMRRLGVSGDWSRERFTMDEGCSEAVREAFVRLYQQDLIYRGQRLVNWDPVLKTAISDLEVVSEEEKGFMWSIRYPLADASGELIVATTRPETLLGDAAVAVHPEDPRYQHLIGKHVTLPLTGRTIPVIADSYVDPAFGTGCVKITPAHDFNDYAVGQRHDLPLINIFTPDASLNEAAPAAYRGLDRYEARRRILDDLRGHNLLVEEKPHTLMVPRGDRTGQVIEPFLTHQWFVRMDGFAQRGLDLVAQGQVKFVPENWVNTYRHWLGNIQDWCISRQLWWGHRIPAWYGEQGELFVARDAGEAHELARTRGYSGPLRQEDDVLETWFSSALWPLSTLGWPDAARQAEYGLDRYLPTSVLVTGFDIIFFWVARMIMMTDHFSGKVPFHEVYITGLVRDAHGQKMSKSKGNILDPLDLIDGITLDALIAKRTSGLMQPQMAAKIEKATRAEFPQGIPAFGTDALRFTFASLATHGRDIKFDLQRCEGYRNFCNKLWNATRYVLMNCEGQDTGLDEHQPLQYDTTDRWIISRLQRTELAIAEAFADYRFDMAARTIYEFVWDEYCDWYLEFAKVSLTAADPARSRATRRTLVRVLDAALRLAHPLIPFITEELWQKVAPLAGCRGDSIMVQAYPVADDTRLDPASEAHVARIKQVVEAIRGLRAELRLSPAQKAPLVLVDPAASLASSHEVLRALCRLASVSAVEEGALPDGLPVALVGEIKLALVLEIDVDAERQRLKAEISRLEGEMARAQGKLANPSFVERAPAAVVDQERQRLVGFVRNRDELAQQLARLN
jgi:valyl-tRNA synthetase